MKRVQTQVNGILRSLNEGVNTQDLSVKMQMLLLQDLLDYSQIKAGKFRKNITRFCVRETINNVMNL